jgi:glycosidase
MPLYWCNHDHPRVVSQYGSIATGMNRPRCFSPPCLFLYGTPFLYNGEEIGMSNATYAGSRGLFHDVGTKNDVLANAGKTAIPKSRFFPICIGAPESTPGPRCNGMTAIPMPAFRPGSRSTPPMPNYLEGVNVLDEMKDPYSILNFYQYAIALRKDPLINDQVLNGPLSIVDPNHPDVFAYMHEGVKKLMVISNMRPYQRLFHLLLRNRRCASS